MDLKQLSKLPEAQAMKEVTTYIDLQLHQGNLTAIDTFITRLEPKGLSVSLNMCIIQAVARVKEQLKNWQNYYLRLRTHLTQFGYDAAFILRGL